METAPAFSRSSQDRAEGRPLETGHGPSFHGVGHGIEFGSTCAVDPMRTCGFAASAAQQSSSHLGPFSLL